MVKFEILPEWYRHNTMVELIAKRSDFYKENQKSICTCDGCALIAVCSLVYDSYNTSGDCLYDK